MKTHDLVIPLGVELPQKLPELGKSRLRWGISQEQPLLLFMSRIDQKKGLDLLIPSLEILLGEGFDFHFVLAGSNPQEPAYEQQIREKIQSSKLGERTTITGFVQGENKFELLTDADLFILPSYYENFGIAVAEAMAIGTPVVISNQVYIWDEVEKAAAGWVTSCSVEGLTQTLRGVLQDEQGRKQRGINARKLVEENYSWDAIALSMVKIYQELS